MLLAFILGFPANEIVLPIILMSYMSTGTLVNLEDTFALGEILIQNGWTLLAFSIPTVCGIVICMITNGIYNLIF